MQRAEAGASRVLLGALGWNQAGPYRLLQNLSATLAHCLSLAPHGPPVHGHSHISQLGYDGVGTHSWLHGHESGYLQLAVVPDHHEALGCFRQDQVPG
jgi:hypothetical protein